MNAHDSLIDNKFSTNGPIISSFFFLPFKLIHRCKLALIAARSISNLALNGLFSNNNKKKLLLTSSNIYRMPKMKAHAFNEEKKMIRESTKNDTV